MLGLSETTFPFGWHYKSLSVSTSSVCFGILCPPFIIKQSLNRYNQVLSHRISYCKTGCQQRFMLEVSGTPCFISNHSKITVIHCLSCSFAFLKPGMVQWDVFLCWVVCLCVIGGQRGACGAVIRVWHCATLTLCLPLSLSLTGASRSACWSRWTRYMGRHSLQRPREGRAWVRLYLAQDTLCHPVCDR